jgi:hypothetical protein
MKTLKDVTQENIDSDKISFEGGFIVQENEKFIPIEEQLGSVLDQWWTFHVGNTGYSNHNRQLLIKEIIRIIKTRYKEDK